MLIPRHWSHVDGVVHAPSGREYALRLWGCSPENKAAAHADAQARYDAARRRIERGDLESDAKRVRSVRALAGAGGAATDDDGTAAAATAGMTDSADARIYTYGRSLLREELLEELPCARGQIIAIRTRNRYGAEILNTASALFLDVDLPADSIGGRVMALLRGRGGSIEARTLDRLRSALASASGGSFRIYRTAAGFRVLRTDRPQQPGERSVVALMRAAGTDPAFEILCRVQKCFRARLTPKPWRIAQSRPPTSFPFDSAADEARMRRWEQAYSDASDQWAVCRLVEQIGPGQVHPDMAHVLEVHDDRSRATSDLPLA